MLNDSFSRHLLRPWSFIRTSDASPAGKDSDTTQRVFQDSFDSLPTDRPPTYRSADAWTRCDDLRQEKGANGWVRFGGPGQEKGVEENQPASGGKGWWREQMLVDRSFRSMAGLTSLFAFIMMIICIRYMPELLGRKSQGSTSVGSKIGQSCRSLEGTNVVSKSLGHYIIHS